MHLRQTLCTRTRLSPKTGLTGKTGSSSGQTVATRGERWKAAVHTHTHTHTHTHEVLWVNIHWGRKIIRWCSDRGVDKSGCIQRSLRTRDTLETLKFIICSEVLLNRRQYNTLYKYGAEPSVFLESCSLFGGSFLGGFTNLWCRVLSASPFNESSLSLTDPRRSLWGALSSTADWRRVDFLWTQTYRGPQDTF